MKTLKLTSKIPVYTAHQWDGTFEGFKELRDVTEHKFLDDPTFHYERDFAWLTIQTNKGELRVNPSNWVFFGPNGIEVFMDFQLINGGHFYDVVSEEPPPAPEEEYIALTDKGKAILAASKSL